MTRNIVLIDNYDSFTYNLVHYMGDLGVTCDVHRNDKITPEEITALKPDGILISPGPSDPNNAGICLETIAEAAKHIIPLLGVCLGYQAIGQSFGGRVTRAPTPMHGKLSPITHNNTGLFKALPSPYNVTRYHSLIVERGSLPETLDITAETDDKIIMGLAHKTLPIHGIQFHPESIATDHGHALLKNFIDML